MPCLHLSVKTQQSKGLGQGSMLRSGLRKSENTGRLAEPIRGVNMVMTPLHPFGPGDVERSCLMIKH